MVTVEVAAFSAISGLVIGLLAWNLRATYRLQATVAKMHMALFGNSEGVEGSDLPLTKAVRELNEKIKELEGGKIRVVTQ